MEESVLHVIVRCPDFRGSDVHLGGGWASGIWLYPYVLFIMMSLFQDVFE